MLTLKVLCYNKPLRVALESFAETQKQALSEEL
jgi:hypothetical protein